MRKDNQYDEIKNFLGIARSLNESSRQQGAIKRFVLTEEEQKRDAIAITNDPRFGDNVLQHQIDAFKQAVNGGAKFGKENPDEPENNPLVYYPKSGNLVFSGSIPQLSNLKFQFSLNDVTGSPYIFVDGLALTDETITTLSRLRGYYLNFRDEFLAAGDMLDKIK